MKKTISMAQSSVTPRYGDFGDDAAGLLAVCPHCGQALSRSTIHRNDTNEPWGA
jgi:hypothetical protein